MAFEHGDKVSDLAVNAARLANAIPVPVSVFWPDPKYFDSAKFSVSRLRYQLRAKAVLCPGLTITFKDHVNSEETTWFYEDGLRDYLTEALQDLPRLPEEPFIGQFHAAEEGAEWAVTWLPEGGDGLGESYVNLIPTAQGGTHVNGLRQGMLEALRDFCEFRNLLPRGVRLTPEDIWDRCSYILSVKMSDPQFSGQTKERLSSRQMAAFVSGVVKDAFSLWLNEHGLTYANKLLSFVFQVRSRRMRAAQEVIP